MAMQKTPLKIFARQPGYYSGKLPTPGGNADRFMSRYWQDEKRDLLNTNVESILEFASSKILIGEDSGILQTSELQGVIQMFSSNISASIFITDVHGEVKLRSENGLAFQNNQVPSMIVTSAIKGEYAGTSTLDGMFEHSCYVVGFGPFWPPARAGTPW